MTEQTIYIIFGIEFIVVYSFVMKYFFYTMSEANEFHFFGIRFKYARWLIALIPCQLVAFLTALLIPIF